MALPRDLLATACAVLAASAHAPACGGPPGRGGAEGLAGDGGADGGPGGGGVPNIAHKFETDVYCRSVAEAACNLAAKCDNETLFGDRTRDAVADCKLTLAAECIPLGLPYERGIAAQATTYNAGSLAECLDAVRRAECPAAAAAWGLSSCERGGARTCDRWFWRTAIEPACQEVFVGQGGADAACHADFECAPGQWCNLARCPGQCERRLQRGEECAYTPLACAPGLVCAGTPRKSCKPLAEEGQECTLDDPAGGGVPRPNCRPPLQCTSGTGGELGGGGTGSYGACRPLAALGDACGQGAARCEPDGYCDFKSMGAIQGDCQPFKALKEDCKDDADPRMCGLGLHCFATGSAPGVPGRPNPEGRCEPYPPVEGLCVKNHANCLDGWCPADAPSWQGFCEPYKDAGADCSASYQCGPGRQCVRESATGSKVCAEIRQGEGFACLRPEG